MAKKTKEGKSVKKPIEVYEEEEEIQTPEEMIDLELMQERLGKKPDPENLQSYVLEPVNENAVVALYQLNPGVECAIKVHKKDVWKTSKKNNVSYKYTILTREGEPIILKLPNSFEGNVGMIYFVRVSSEMETFQRNEFYRTNVFYCNQSIPYDRYGITLNDVTEKERKKPGRKKAEEISEGETKPKTKKKK